MEWIVAFAQRDISGLSEGDTLNLRYEVKAFSKYGISTGQKVSGKPHFSLGPGQMRTFPMAVRKTRPFFDDLLPSWNEIERTQREVRSILGGPNFHKGNRNQFS